MNKALLMLVPALLLASCQQPLPQPKPQPAPKQEKPAEEAEPAAVVEVPKGDFNPLDIPGKKAEGYKNPFPKGSYEHFVAKPAYPRTMAVFEDNALLNQISPANSKLIIWNTHNISNILFPIALPLNRCFI